MHPETRYAKSGDVSIAYQVVGDGPFDLVVVPGWISNVDFAWEDPLYGDWVRRLTAFSRVILFDKRGTGLSDRDVGDSTLEERMDDLRAVLATRRVQSGGGPWGSPKAGLVHLFAATYPQRPGASSMRRSRVRLRLDIPKASRCGKRSMRSATRSRPLGTGHGTLDLMVPS